MRAQRTALAALGGFLLIVAGLVIWQLWTAQTTRANRSAIALKRANVVFELRALQSSIDQLELEKARLKKSLAAAKPQAVPPAGVDTPEQHRARIRTLHAWLSLRNAALYRKLGLSPGQISQYEDLSVSHFLRMQDIVATAQAEKIPLSDPAITKLSTEENQQFKQETADLMGETTSQQIQQYNRTAQARMLASAAAGNTYYTETPLTAQQGDQLTQILANNSATYQKGLVVSAGTPNDINMDAAVSQAQGTVSPAQIASLKNAYQGMVELSKLQQLLASLVPSSPPSTQTQAAAAGK